MAKAAKLIHFKVTGRGAFPFDMLRYDSCFPATSADAAALDAVDYHTRTVELVLALPRMATFARWASFGWTVSEYAGRRAPDMSGRIRDMQAIATRTNDSTLQEAATKRIERLKRQRAACTYPACKCIVSTSTSDPHPVCPLFRD